ncbi:MAG TPA: GNAT family N-acyltransferase [Candidatus Aquicultor sp.]|jgi:N-acyl-L-homoserine lactone synthetase
MALVRPQSFSNLRAFIKNQFPTFTERGVIGKLLDPDNPTELDLLRRFRYKYWVERFKYVDETETDGEYEYDKYDEHSTHFGVFDQDTEDIIGYARIISPGKHGLQVDNVFEDLVHPRAPDTDRMPRSAESSRLIVAPEAGGKRRDVARMLYKLQYQFFKRYGFKYWYTTTYIPFLRALRAQKYKFDIIGPGQDYQGHMCFPTLMVMDEFDAYLSEKDPEHYYWLNDGIDEIKDINSIFSDIPEDLRLFNPEYIVKRKK